VCAKKDDMQGLLEKMLAAPELVLGSTNYYKSVFVLFNMDISKRKLV
jgi:hypothetical protein